MSKICSIEGCEKPAEARCLCNTHYMQQRRANLLPIGTRARGTVEERFWRFVAKSDGCWLWTGKSVNTKGYGQLGALGGKGTKGITAHRLSYTIHKGEIPEGMVVMHSCDNPACVNPDHLSVGTQSQNILEAIAKGRKVLPKLPHPSGADHPFSKLTEENVREIRSSPVMDTVFAKRFGVAPSTVRRARIGLAWGNLAA
jgi:HNH endonuclease